VQQNWVYFVFAIHADTLGLFIYFVNVHISASLGGVVLHLCSGVDFVKAY
jgi:hypothetical protein